MSQETHYLRDRNQDNYMGIYDDAQKVDPFANDAAAAASAEDSDQIECIQQQQQQKKLNWLEIILLNISFFGLNLMFLVLSVEVVPSQVHSLVGDNSSSKGSVLGGMVAGGAVVTLICGPAIGMLSDRLRSRFGRRRPIMVTASICLCVALLGMSLAAPKVFFKEIKAVSNGSNNLDSFGLCNNDLVAVRCNPYSNYGNSSSKFSKILNNLHAKKFPMKSQSHSVNVKPSFTGNLGLFIIFYFLVMAAYVCTITPYNALIADLTHPSQRGISSGMMGGMILLGNIAGAALGLFLASLGVLTTYLIVISILAVCIAITVGSVSEPTAKEIVMPLSWRNVVVGFWEPLKEHDFRWVFVTRFLMQQGLSTIVGFLEFWLSDMVNLPHCWDSAKGVSILLLPLLCTAAIASILGGRLSDKVGKRKPLIKYCSIIMGISSGILATIRGKGAFYLAIGVSVLFGAAFGGYQAVDFALVMDVLPHTEDISRDIAVWQQAMVLPQALAVPIGGIILDLFERINCSFGLGYTVLFSVTALYFVMGGVFVNRIKRAK